MAVPGRPTPNRWKESALEPGPPASYGSTQAVEYPPTAAQTTECLVTLLWMILAICLAAKASDFFTAIRDLILKLKGKE
jgi:hypothetical protein